MGVLCIPLRNLRWFRFRVDCSRTKEVNKLRERNAGGMSNMALYLYKLTSGSYDYGRYDCYDSCVVAAESEETARLIYPDAKKDGSWASDEQAIEQWTTPENVEIELIGTAAFGIQKGVICASFNAG